MFTWNPWGTILTPHLTLLQAEAILVMNVFTTAVLTAPEFPIPRVLGDLIGTFHDNSLIVVKIRRIQGKDPLTPDQVWKKFSQDILLMQCWIEVHAVRKELWILRDGKAWQFFEVMKEDIREVTHEA